jgi:hypothetical protein
MKVLVLGHDMYYTVINSQSFTPKLETRLWRTYPKVLRPLDGANQMPGEQGMQYCATTARKMQKYKKRLTR